LEGRKPSLKHFHIWGCPYEVRPYRPNKKNELQNVSNHFIVYSERSRGYKFYDPTIRSIFETGLQHFLRMLSLRGEKRLETLFLRRNQFRSPTITFDSVQAFIPVIVREADMESNKTMLNNSSLKQR